MQRELQERIESALGVRVVGSSALSGGSVANVARVECSDGSSIVAKSGQPGLLLEAWMLERLAATATVPVPRVLDASDTLLLLSYVENDGGGLGASAQRSLAAELAALHAVEADTFGLERDTVIGGLHQPNARCTEWIPFFAEQRLLHMGAEAERAGALPSGALAGIERLCARLDEWIEPAAPPALIHGDLWGGNILVRDGRLAALIDPAIDFADPEIELAFATLFGTVDRAFFEAYAEIRPIAPGFFEVRRDLYNLYPLLVHAVLFGSGYGAQVDSTVRRWVG